MYIFKIPESLEFYGGALIFLRSCRQLPFAERGAYKFVVKHPTPLLSPTLYSCPFSFVFEKFPGTARVYRESSQRQKQSGS